MAMQPPVHAARHAVSSGHHLATQAGYEVLEFGGRVPTGIPRSAVPAAPDAWIAALGRYADVARATQPGSNSGSGIASSSRPV